MRYSGARGAVEKGVESVGGQEMECVGEALGSGLIELGGNERVGDYGREDCTQWRKAIRRADRLQWTIGFGGQRSSLIGRIVCALHAAGRL